MLKILIEENLFNTGDRNLQYSSNIVSFSPRCLNASRIFTLYLTIFVFLMQFYSFTQFLHTCTSLFYYALVSFFSTQKICILISTFLEKIECLSLQQTSPRDLDSHISWAGQWHSSFLFHIHQTKPLISSLDHVSTELMSLQNTKPKICWGDCRVLLQYICKKGTYENVNGLKSSGRQFDTLPRENSSVTT